RDHDTGLIRSPLNDVTFRRRTFLSVIAGAYYVLADLTGDGLPATVSSRPVVDVTMTDLGASTEAAAAANPENFGESVRAGVGICAALSRPVHHASDVTRPGGTTFMAYATRGALCVLLLLGLVSSAAAQTFTMYLVGQPGEWITLGQTRTFTQDNASLYFIRRNSFDGVTFNGVDFGILDSAGSLWDVSFNSPLAAAFVADNYEDAQRFPFNSPTKPGLIQSGEWRSCSYVDGRFIVREVVYGANNDVLSLAVDFVQQCDFTPPLVGFIRYNSTIPLVVPTPNAAAGSDLVVDEGQTVQLDGSNSSDGDGSIVAYRWLQLSGPTLAIADPTAALTPFVPPSLPPPGHPPP